MDEDNSLEVTGQSGKTYKYRVYEMGTKFKQVPANYVVLKKSATRDKWGLVYAGETDDLSVRFEEHPKILCMRNNDASHIAVHGGSQERTVRLQEVSDIIEKWTPICNR